MNKTLFPITALAMTVCMSLGFPACCDNDNDDDENKIIDGGSIDIDTPDIDEMDALQQNLVRVDSLGNFERRVFGVALDKGADSTVVSVGVKSFDDAQKKFQCLFANTTKISEDGNRATFTSQQGEVNLVQEDGKDGLVASATFNLPKLKYVSKINFLLDSAWPENAGGRKGFHKYGYWYKYHGFTSDDAKRGLYKSDWHDFLCVREYSNGNPALLVALSPRTYILRAHVDTDAPLGNVPYKSKAQEIHQVISSNWDTFKKMYNDKIGHEVLNETGEYWLRDAAKVSFHHPRWTINLYNGKTEWYCTYPKDPQRTILFYIESLEMSD